MRKKLFIFDLDGTLVDAYPAITESVNFAMRKLGYPVQSACAIKKAVGRGDANLLKDFISHKDLSKALRVYRSHHAASLKHRVRWLPHAKELLACLKKKGYSLAIASNRPTRFTQIILKALAGHSFFDMVLCTDKLKFGKPHALILNKIIRHLGACRADVFYVGDMALDVQTGHRARVTTVAVATGSSTPAELKKAQPTYLFSSLKKLKDGCRNCSRVLA
jgi:phosphoglycolate phosphatase